MSNSDQKIGQSPIVVGALCGFFCMALVIVCIFVALGVGYYFHTGTEEEYFEDGAFLTLVVFPPVYIVTWGAFAAALGGIGGAFVSLIQKRMNKETVHPQSTNT